MTATDDVNAGTNADPGVLPGLTDVATGGRLWIESRGDGPAALLLHSGLVDSRMFDSQMGSLANGGFRAVRFDFRGYGRSDRPDSAFSDPDDVVAVLDALELDRAALVGSSKGGAVALGMAVEHPDRVTALVLAGSGIPGHPDWSPRMRAIWDEVDEAVKAGDLERAHELDMSPWVLTLGEPSDDLIRAIGHDNAHVLTIDEELETWPTEPLEPRLHEISAPTLVAVGDRDIPEMLAIADLLAERIPNAEGPLVIEGADHLLPTRRPAEFDRAMLEFLGRTVAA
ncbi:MAG TPA: alpha/beta hydrolase [Actinomycetota bacterium]|nr:alpha/beta hydrolase [Actinomycetota bacterium]